MRYYTNECVDCGLPCLREACMHYKVEHIACDSCQEEKKLYYYNGLEMCLDCILDDLEVVEGTENWD